MAGESRLDHESARGAHWLLALHRPFVAVWSTPTWTERHREAGADLQDDRESGEETTVTRQHLIGGTDAASLLGLGRESPTALFLRLRGDVKDTFEGNEATFNGSLWEDRCAADAVKHSTGLDIVRPPERTLVLPDEPRVGASLDFELAGGGGLVEIKTSGSRRMWGEPGERVPLHVAAQCQFQMAMARARGRAVPCTHVIALFFPGFIMHDFPVEEDQQVGSMLVASAKDMLRRVDQNDPPTPGSEADARALFLGRRGESYAATLEDIALIAQLRELEAAKDIAEEQIKTVRDALLPRFGSATEIVDPATGELIATFRANKAFDENAFGSEHTDPQFYKSVVDKDAIKKFDKKLYEAFMREPKDPQEQVRRFMLKTNKEKS